MSVDTPQQEKSTLAEAGACYRLGIVGAREIKTLHPRTTLVAETDLQSATELFNEKTLDLAVISAAPDKQAELCIQALESGVRAILCDFPFANNIDDGKKVLEAVSAHKAELTINYELRWSARYKALSAFLESGEIGVIESVGLHYTGGIMHQGIQGIDIIRMLFGDVALVRTSDRHRLENNDVNLGGILQMEAGFPAFLTVGETNEPAALEFEFVGEEGQLVMSDKEIHYTKYLADEKEEERPAPFSLEHGDCFTAAIDELVSFLESGESANSCTPEDGLKAIQVVETLQASAEKNGKDAVVPPL